MTFSIWLAFFFSACLIAISPGPGAILSMSHGLTYGVKKTSATILGLQVGLLLMLIVVGFGLGSILLASNTAFNVMKMLGAAYLIYLGICQWRAGSGSYQDAVNDQENKLGLSWRARFLTGFLTNVTNPKGIVFMAAVLPQFILPDVPIWSQIIILSVTMCAIDLVVMHTYAWAASFMRTLMLDTFWVNMQNRLLGGLLMAVGVLLFFFKRS